MNPETVLAAIKSSSPPNWLGYFFRLSALTPNLRNNRGERASRADVAVGLDILTKFGCQLTIIDDRDGKNLEYREYRGDVKRDLIEKDFQLWLIPAANSRASSPLARAAPLI